MASWGNGIIQDQVLDLPYIHCGYGSSNCLYHFFLSNFNKVQYFVYSSFLIQRKISISFLIKLSGGKNWIGFSSTVRTHFSWSAVYRMKNLNKYMTPTKVYIPFCMIHKYIVQLSLQGMYDVCMDDIIMNVHPSICTHII